MTDVRAGQKPDCIIGVGSPFGEDQCGWYAAELIDKYVPGTQVVKCDRPSLGLVDHLKNDRYIVIIDALNDPHRKHGELVELAIDNLPKERLLSSHGFGVAEALQLARKLDLLPNDLILFGIVIDPEQVSISEPVLKACHSLCETVKQRLDRENH